METTEITIQSKVQQVIAQSGVAFELNLTKVANLAERAKSITSVDDKNFLPVKKELQQTRKYVTEYFKDARDEYNRRAKGVIEVQNMVLDEFTPEENRLKELDKAEKERLVREARLASLPARKERFESIGYGQAIPDGMTFDDFLLEMDDADFEIYLVELQGKKNEADRLELEAEKTRMAEEAAAKEAALAAKQAEADRIEAARVEEREKAAEALRIEKERLESEKADAEARRVREQQEAEQRRIEAIQREEAEKARIAQEEKDKIEAARVAKEEAEKAAIAAAEAKAADEKYQAWKTELGEGEFKFITLENGNVEAYKLVSTYAKD